MANALKCDRCGKFYEKYDGIKVVSGGNKYCFFSISNCSGLITRDYDLCPECMKSLIEWIWEADNES